MAIHIALFFGTLFILPVLIILAVLIFEIAMIIHALQNKNLSDNARLLWIVGMVFIHPFVAIAYYILEYRK